MPHLKPLRPLQALLEPERVSLVTAPAQLPVSLNEVKKHLDIADSDVTQDALLQGFLAASVDSVEKFLRRALLTQTWQLFRDAWPFSALDEAAEAVDLPKSPLQSVTHVKTYDDDDVATTLAVADYFVDAATEPGRVKLRRGLTIPTIDRTANGLEIQFVAGYGDNPGDVPEPIRRGIMVATTSAHQKPGERQVKRIEADDVEVEYFQFMGDQKQIAAVETLLLPWVAPLAHPRQRRLLRS